MMLTPQTTYSALLVVQALHLLHHRLAKRHISFAEVISAVILCVPPWAPLPPLAFMGAHLTLIAVQLVGSLWIKKLSPEWINGKELLSSSSIAPGNLDIIAKRDDIMRRT